MLKYDKTMAPEHTMGDKSPKNTAKASKNKANQKANQKAARDEAAHPSPPEPTAKPARR